MSEDIRSKFFTELQKKVEEGNYKATVSFSFPSNGETIKLSGVVLYKIIRISNRWGGGGVVIHKAITENGLKAVAGGKATGKNQWAGCKLTETNYKVLMEILLDIISKSNIKRGNKMKEASKVISKPKKKMIKKLAYLINR